MKIKVSELTDVQLSWAVAIALEWKWKVDDGKIILARPTKIRNNKQAFDTLGLAHFHPTKSWSIAGPIIEHEGIGLDQYADYPRWQAFTPAPEQQSGQAVCNGPTPLIAAMRCYVASKLGDDVEVPEELCPPTA